MKRTANNIVGFIVVSKTTHRMNILLNVVRVLHVHLVKYRLDRSLLTLAPLISVSLLISHSGRQMLAANCALVTETHKEGFLGIAS